MLYFSILCGAAAVGMLVLGTPLGVWRGSTFAGAVFRLTAVNLFCAGVLAGTLLLGTSRLNWLVRLPVLRWFGEISYGLYLVHMLAFDFMDHWIVRYFPGLYALLPSSFLLLFSRFLIAMGLAVGVAFLSRRYFEEWFLELKDRWTPPVSSPSGEPALIMDNHQAARRTA
jgi:peptidoglycan/LPS O-acetylase OafA/YrhL